MIQVARSFGRPLTADDPPTADSPPTAHDSPTANHPRDAWRNVDPDVLTTLADEITSLSAHLHAETRRLLSLVARFDRLEGWKREGFASCADWLAYRTRLDRATAREKVRVARALARLPETDAAMERGELSFSQVRALTRVANPENEGELLEHARSLSAAGLERLVRSWRRLGRADEAVAEERRHASRCLSVFPDDDGSYVIRGRLDPEVGALLMRAIEAAGDAEYRGSVPGFTPEQRRADAIGLLAERALAAGFGEGASRSDDEGAWESGGAREDRRASEGELVRGVRADRYLVVLHVDPVRMAETGAADVGDAVIEPATSGPAASEPGRSHLEDGTRVSAETSRRLGCDATVVRVRDSGGEGPGHGDSSARGAVERRPFEGAMVELRARTRVVPPRMRRALELRDHGCRFPGCGSRFTDAHHIRHWVDGGPTRLDNLILLCRTHHRLLHEGGFRIVPDPERAGGAVFSAPTGVRIPETPPRMRLNGRPVGRGGVSRWEEDVPLALYLAAMASLG